MNGEIVHKKWMLTKTWYIRTELVRIYLPGLRRWRLAEHNFEIEMSAKFILTKLKQVTSHYLN